jgi:hypothetical protein
VGVALLSVLVASFCLVLWPFARSVPLLCSALLCLLSLWRSRSACAVGHTEDGEGREEVCVHRVCAAFRVPALLLGVTGSSPRFPPIQWPSAAHTETHTRTHEEGRATLTRCNSHPLCLCCDTQLPCPPHHRRCGSRCLALFLCLRLSGGAPNGVPTSLRRGE